MSQNNEENKKEIKNSNRKLNGQRRFVVKHCKFSLERARDNTAKINNKYINKKLSAIKINNYLKEK
jgi:hypothetical protein